MKKFVVILIIVLICGIISADICLKQLKESMVFVGKDFYVQYANANYSFKDIFWNIFYERIKLIGVIILFCFTPIRKKIGFLLAPLFCFAWGFFLMNCITTLGFAGVVVGLASVLPHGILYIAIIGIVSQLQNRKNYHFKNYIAKHMIIYLCTILLFLTACVLESLVGAHFIPWVIRLSLI